MSSPSTVIAAAPTAAMESTPPKGKSPAQLVNPTTPSTPKSAGKALVTVPVRQDSSTNAAGAQLLNTTPAPTKSINAAFLATIRAESSKQGAAQSPFDVSSEASTDSDDDASDWADDESEVDQAAESDANLSSSPVASPSGGTPVSGGKTAAGKQVRKRATTGTSAPRRASVTKKRARRDSDASNTSSNGTPAAKRTRWTEKQRQGPTAKESGPLDNGEMAAFTATIYIIYLGPNGRQFHVHESVLRKSPRMISEIAKARRNKRSTRQNVLYLLPHDSVAFEQMVEYLYKDKFTLSKNKDTAVQRLAEIQELFSLAKHYVLPDLQRQVVRLFSASKFLQKVHASTFFDWAEDMYYDELDHRNGAFKVYLMRVGPALMRGLGEDVIKDIGRMVKNGGAFAEDLFMAAYQVLVESLPVVKPEPTDMDIDS